MVFWAPSYYQEGDEYEIIALMEDDISRRASHAVFDINFWTCKYRNNYAGFYKNWISLARSEKTNMLGGHYTVIPVYMKILGEKILASQSVDTITHIDFRNQGVFTGLAKLCYKQVASTDVGIIIGFPNESSFPGFIKKLNWTNIMQISELGYVLRPYKTSYAKFNSRLVSSLVGTALNLFKKYTLIKSINWIKNNYNIKAISIDEIDY